MIEKLLIWFGLGLQLLAIGWFISLLIRLVVGVLSGPAFAWLRRGGFAKRVLRGCVKLKARGGAPAAQSGEDPH